MQAVPGWEAAAPKVRKPPCHGEGPSRAQALHPRTLDSLGDGLDDLGGGVLEVGEQAPGAPPQDVQEPAVGLLVLSNRQACKQRRAQAGPAGSVGLGPGASASPEPVRATHSPSPRRLLDPAWAQELNQRLASKPAPRPQPTSCSHKGRAWTQPVRAEPPGAHSLHPVSRMCTHSRLQTWTPGPLHTRTLRAQQRQVSTRGGRTQVDMEGRRGVVHMAPAKQRGRGAGQRVCCYLPAA